VRRQVKIIRGKQVFAPIKNDKTHDVPSLNCCARFWRGTCRCSLR
jgi:hypothetical protein